MRRDDLGGLWFDLLIGMVHSDALARTIADAGAVEIDPGVADVRRIESGRPVFGKDMTEEKIPASDFLTPEEVAALLEAPSKPRRKMPKRKPMA